MRLSIRILAMAMVAMVGSALAQPVSGPTHSGVFRSRDRVVALPPGQWVEFSRHAWTGNPRGPGFSYEEVGLARVTSSGVDALIHLRSVNLEEGAAWVARWGTNPACTRTDTHFVQVRSRDDQDQECLLLNHVIGQPPANRGPVWADYAGLRRGREGQFPATLIATTFHLARITGGSTLTYYFGVERHGFAAQPASWVESPWHPSRADAPRLTIVQAYKGWMSANAPAVLRGLEGSRSVELSAAP